MTSGGARATSGPPPDPNALRRDRKSDPGWTTLPKERKGDLPPWPLEGQNAREAGLWESLWTRPQATQWEATGQQMEVALYTRRLAEAEKRESSVALGTLVRQMADALGLTIPGLRVNRWKIAGDEVKAKREEKAAAKPASSGVRDRFKVVRGDGQG